jgi:Holliday junction resolvase RusA-like endonuclease
MEFPIPPNTNHAYRRRKQGGMYLTDEGQRFKALVGMTIKQQQPDFAIPKKTPLSIEMAFYLPSNRLNINDWDGLIKLLQDAIFETGGGNDAWVREAVVYKFGPNLSAPEGQVFYSEVKLSMLPKEVRL